MRRNFLLLLSGAGGAQLITICLLPVLGRLYDAEAFGHLGVVMAIVSVSAVVVHGRYQMAIPLTCADEDASALLVLAILLSLALSLPVTAAVALISRPDSGLSFTSLLAWAAALTLLTALIDVSSYWRSRQGRFGVTARNGMIRNAAAGAGQIGLASLGSTGLLLGAFAGAALATVTSAIDVVRRDRALLSTPGWRRLADVAKEHRHHPLYGVPQGWIASISWNLMPLLLMRYSGAAVAGQYWVAYRILVAPVALFNNAYRQASFPHFTASGLARGSRLAARHSLLILGAGLLPVAILYRFGDELLSLLMGPTWALAGVIAGWMSVGILADFVKVPVQCLLQSHARQGRLLVWEGVIVVSRYTIAIPFAATGQPVEAVAAFSLAGLAGRILFIAVELFLLGRSEI